jgi:glucan phosphoethanolaminetransferase (alkaline phosphatase superfamily)
MKTNMIILIVVFSVLATSLLATNSLILKKDSSHGYVDIVLTLGLVAVFILMTLNKSNSCDNYTYNSNFRGWNPDSYRHAYLGNDLVAGTVYAEDPENDPGLGWIL